MNSKKTGLPTSTCSTLVTVSLGRVALYEFRENRLTTSTCPLLVKVCLGCNAYYEVRGEWADYVYLFLTAIGKPDLIMIDNAYKACFNVTIHIVIALYKT